MIKSQYADPRFNEHGFTNHLHHVIVQSGVHPGTTEPLMEIYSIELTQNIHATSGKGGKPRNIMLFFKPIPRGSNMLGGLWQLIHVWIEGVDYDDSSAAASIAVHPITGNLHIEMTFGKLNADGKITYQKWEEQINRTTFTQPLQRT